MITILKPQGGLRLLCLHFRQDQGGGWEGGRQDPLDFSKMPPPPF